VAAALALGLIGAPAASAQSVQSYWLDPLVIPANRGQPVLLQVAVSGTPTAVRIDPGPGSAESAAILLHDDGANGDKIARDHVYSAQLQPGPILAALRPDDVHRVFLGYLDLFVGTTNVLRLNLFTAVSGADVPPQPIAQLSPSIQAAPHIVNIAEPAFFQTFIPSLVTRDFYQVFGDDYDFIALISSPSRVANRDHFLVRNDVFGDGQPQFDSSVTYGSTGRLQGVSRFPIADLYDGADVGYIHELGHQWINFLRFAPLATGVPHWPLSSMASGIMGFSVGGAGGEGGQFPCDVKDVDGTFFVNPRSEGPIYNDFDLYLMGLIPREQVRPQVVWADQSRIPSCGGQALTTGTLPVTVDDIIANFGPRLPAAGDAPTRFHVANILVTPSLVDAETMWLFDWLAARAQLETKTPSHEGFVKQTVSPFFLATGGRARLDTTIPIDAPGFVVRTPADAQLVTSGGLVTFAVTAAPAGASFDGMVALGCSDLPAHASCTFSAPFVIPGTSGAEVLLTINTRDAGSSTPALPGRVAFPIIIGGLLFAGWPARHGGSGRSSKRAWVRGALVGLAAMALCACSGPKSRPDNGVSTPVPIPVPVPVTTLTPAGIYTIKVTGVAGGIEQATPMTLTVQQ
jgi:hypothetical protein